MRTAVLAKILYGVFGALYLTAGATVLLFRTGLLPETVKNIILDVARDDLNAVHLSQEFGTFLVFAGLITFWFVRHYEQSLLFHWAMTATWGLFAFVHWYDVRGPFQSAVGPTINTIPFLLFVAVGLLTLNRKPGRKGDEKKVAVP